MTKKRRKKVGLFTFSWIDNPGSVLQAYALKTVLEEKGLSVSVLNYQNTLWADFRLIRGIDTFPRKIWTWRKKKIYKWRKLERKHKEKMGLYENFQKEYLKIDSPAVKPDDLSRRAAKLDALIVGSDQIWNYDLPLVDSCYFAGFPKAPAKRYSYAASFGKVDFDEERVSEASELLKQFSRISVREKSGQALAERLSGKKVSVHLDPTLLLTADVWEKLETEPPLRNYVFVYLREKSDVISEYAQKIASERGLQVVSIIRGKMTSPEEKEALGPQEWLGYIHHADIVLTNSFHGICFSLIFEKEFKVFALEKSEWRKRSNTRLESIIELLDLQNAVQPESDDGSGQTALPEIQYEKVNSILEKERKSAFEYIQEIAEDIYGK